MDQDRQNRDRPLIEAARMVGAAVASAAVTATLVILIGQSLMDPAPPRPEPAFIRTAG